MWSFLKPEHPWITRTICTSSAASMKNMRLLRSRRLIKTRLPLNKMATPPRTIRARESFAKDLERVEMRITPSDAWTDCGGSFEKLGTDVMEELETA